MRLHLGHFRSGQFSVYKSVQQGGVFMDLHFHSPLSGFLDAAGAEKFPCSIKKFRSCRRPRLIRDFTVPRSSDSASAISS